MQLAQSATAELETPFEKTKWRTRARIGVLKMIHAAKDTWIHGYTDIRDVN